MMNLDIADIDCIYLSYDEPEKEEFWIKLRNMIPWVKRVDGVKGSDEKMFMLANNRSSPECCPATFSTSTGCVCTTKNQRDYLSTRGINDA